VCWRAASAWPAEAGRQARGRSCDQWSRTRNKGNPAAGRKTRSPQLPANAGSFIHSGFIHSFRLDPPLCARGDLPAWPRPPGASRLSLRAGLLLPSHLNSQLHRSAWQEPDERALPARAHNAGHMRERRREEQPAGGRGEARVCKPAALCRPRGRRAAGGLRAARARPAAPRCGRRRTGARPLPGAHAALSCPASLYRLHRAHLTMLPPGRPARRRRSS